MADTNILVMSDTHNNSKAVRQLIDNYYRTKFVFTVIHLGDHIMDIIRNISAEEKNEFHLVFGNSDSPLEGYEERIIEIAGKKIFITHGHFHEVKFGTDKIVYKAKELGVDACLFGHSHLPTLFEQDGILFLNPGSTTYPPPGQNKGYALLRISEDGTITGKLLVYKEAL